MEIVSIRKKTGLSRAAFSKKYGIPVRTIEDWEAGKRTPPEYVVRLLCDAAERDIKSVPAKLDIVDRLDLGDGFFTERYRSSEYEVSVTSSNGSVSLTAKPLMSWLPEIHMCDGEVTKIGFVGDVILEDNLAACAEGLNRASSMIEMLRGCFF